MTWSKAPFDTHTNDRPTSGALTGEVVVEIGWSWRRISLDRVTSLESVVEHCFLSLSHLMAQLILCGHNLNQLSPPGTRRCKHGAWHQSTLVSLAVQLPKQSWGAEARL